MGLRDIVVTWLVQVKWVMVVNVLEKVLFPGGKSCPAQGWPLSKKSIC